MKTIREIAREQLAKTGLRVGDAMHYERALDFAESVLAEYLAQQEPVGRVTNCSLEGQRISIMSDALTAGDYVFLAPPIPAGMVEILHCPNCDDTGQYWDGPTDDPNAVQCEFCYTVPNSYFNLREVITAAKESNHAESKTL